METDRLVSLLAADVTPVDSHAATRRFSWALLAGAIGAMLLVLIFYGPRPDLREMLVTPLFLANMAFPAALAAGRRTPHGVGPLKWMCPGATGASLHNRSFG
jgi:hypothetical protein